MHFNHGCLPATVQAFERESVQSGKKEDKVTNLKWCWLAGNIITTPLADVDTVWIIRTYNLVVARRHVDAFEVFVGDYRNCLWAVDETWKQEHLLQSLSRLCNTGQFVVAEMKCTRPCTRISLPLGMLHSVYSTWLHIFSLNAHSSSKHAAQMRSGWPFTSCSDFAAT